ncbi:MAG: hypothetical protein IRY99_18435, partial [Isosphaeraceae bacterium]|nr:hypothetical protein [Isosphaeraceae bacterium]
MPVELLAVATRIRRFRWDPAEREQPEEPPRWPLGIVLALAGFFVLWGGGSLDLGPIEARQGLAASEPIGPLGMIFGGWEPSLWPGRVWPSQLWAWMAGEANAGVVRWPDAIAAVALSLLVARRVGLVFGARAAVLAGLVLCGTVGGIDRSAGAGIDLIAGLFVVAALDRIQAQGSDRVAGLWTSLALLAGGWPPLALIALPIVVLGRAGRGLAKGLVLPPLLAGVAWSAWALAVMPARAWAAALALPLTQPMAWWLPLALFGLGLPWAPCAALVAFRSVREGWSPSGRELVFGWLQVAGVAVLA